MKKRLLPIIVVIAVLMVAIVAAVVNQESKQELTIAEVDFSFCQESYAINKKHFCDAGIVLVNEEDLLTYTSPEKGASVTLCSNPDCMHNGEDCPAWFAEQNVLTVYYYNDKQYLLMESKLSTHSKPKLYEANADGTNRKEIHSFDLYDAFIGAPVCYNNKMILFLSSISSNDTFIIGDNGETIEQAREITMVVYDLDSKEISYSKTYDSNFCSFITMTAMEEGKAYFKYQYSSLPQHEIWDENDEETEKMAEAFIMGGGCFDLTGDEVVASSLCASSECTFIGYDNGAIYYYEDAVELHEKTIYKKDLKSGTITELQVDLGGDSTWLYVANNKFFLHDVDRDMVYEYDIATEKLTKRKGSFGYVEGRFGDYYLVSGGLVKIEDYGKRGKLIEY